MRKWQCVMISGITAAVMVLGGCGAAGNRTDVLSASAAGTENKQAAASSSMDVRETPVASSADSTESVSSSSDDDQALADAFNKLMDEVQDSVYPGSAGASLNAAYAGADILTWYVNNRASLTAEKITALRDAYLASQDDADSFTQQLDAVANSILYLSDDMAEGELSDAGWQGSISWTADDCTLVGQALQSSQTASADAASALQPAATTSRMKIPVPFLSPAVISSWHLTALTPRQKQAARRQTALVFRQNQVARRQAAQTCRRKPQHFSAVL